MHGQVTDAAPPASATAFVMTEFAVHPDWMSPLQLHPGTRRVVHGQNGATGDYTLSDEVLTIEWDRCGSEKFYKLGDRFIQERFLDRTSWPVRGEREAKELSRLQRFEVLRCSPTSRPYLLSIRTGREGNFRSWFDDVGRREWDLHLSSHADPSDPLSSEAEIVTCGGVSKFSAAYDFNREHEGIFDRYEAVSFIDDDIQIDFGDVDRLFDMLQEYDLLLLQPALSHSSYASWPETLLCPSFKFRFTNFVEVMAPFFARSALRLALPTFKMSLSSWGLDYLWPHLLGTPQERVAIIDSVSIKHEKQIDTGSGPFYRMLRSIGVDAFDEFHFIMRSFGLDRRIRHFGAVMTDGSVLRFVERG